MKLDKDLVREVLLAVEADEGDPRDWTDMNISGHNQGQVAYHIQILAEGGFLEAEDLGSHDGYDWRAKRLTYEGHEFPNVWLVQCLPGSKTSGRSIGLGLSYALFRADEPEGRAPLTVSVKLFSIASRA
jgi:hypothetical protein